MINFQQIKTDLNSPTASEMMVKTKEAADVSKKNSVYRKFTDRIPRYGHIQWIGIRVGKTNLKTVINEVEGPGKIICC